MSTEARESKKAIREAIKAGLSKLSENEIATQSHQAQLQILSLPDYRTAKTVSIYLSMPVGEARTDLLVRDALSSGKKVFVPYIHSLPPPPPPHEEQGGNGDVRARGKGMSMLRLRSVEEYEGLQRDGWGIPFLPSVGVEGRENAMGGLGQSYSFGGEGEEEGGLDLIVVPGVAFDEKMSRMGHGAGFYDSYLTRFCNGGERRKPFLAGLCLAEQILPAGRIVMQEWDWRVDVVAVGDGRLLEVGD